MGFDAGTENGHVTGCSSGIGFLFLWMEALCRSRKELHRMQVAATLDVLCSNQVVPLGYVKMSQPLTRWFVLNKKKKKGANAALTL
jgi:hypothetical protein